MCAWAVVHRKYGGSNQGGRGRDGHKGGCKALQFPSWNLEEADGWHCVGALLACPFYTTDKRRGGNLANYCVGMADMGFGLSREDVMRTAFLIVEKSGATTHSRMACQREHGLMALLHVTLSYRSILRKPCLVLKKQLMRYLDKTGISTEAWKGNHWNVRQVISAEEGKTHKVLVCLSCSNVFPPMMIYPHQCLTKWKKVLFLVPSRSLNDLFFLESIPSALSVLIIEDGHSSHISIEVMNEACKNDVYLLCLPAHTTHILQPLDVAVFKSLKACKAISS